MDDLDHRLLQALQRGFPLEPEPYAALAREIGSDEETLFRRTMALVDDGTIRRLGPSFDSRRIGHATTLVALRLPEDRLAEVAERVSRYDEVTHNYQRRDAWNLWFALVARSPRRIRTILDEIRRDAGINAADMMNLPVRRLFKIDVRFPTR